MNRRELLKGVAAIPVAAAVPEFPVSDFQRSRLVSSSPKNTLTTIDMITREALRIAHEKMNFIRSVGGNAKVVGDTLNIRMPARYGG